MYRRLWGLKKILILFNKFHLSLCAVEVSLYTTDETKGKLFNNIDSNDYGRGHDKSNTDIASKQIETNSKCAVGDLGHCKSPCTYTFIALAAVSREYIFDGVEWGLHFSRGSVCGDSKRYCVVMIKSL